MQHHGLMTSDAGGRKEPVQFAVPSQVVRGTPSETGYLYLVSADEKMMIGVWTCEAYAERLVDYAYNEMCTLIEGAVEITADGGETVTYRAGDTFFMAKGFTGLWESHGRFTKYFMISA